MQTIKCPLSAYGACSELAEVAQFGEHTKSSQRGHKKKYIKCPTHGSIRLDKDSAQLVIAQLIDETAPEKKASPKVESEKVLDNTSDEWGF